MEVASPARHAASAADFNAARLICRKHAKSFYFASAFLPKPKREAAFAIYAFCRLLDDAVDLPGATREQGEINGGIARFKCRLRLMYDLDSTEPPSRPFGPADEQALRAFAATVHRYNVPQAYFTDLIDGCGMDLTRRRYATWPDLERYCYHVAGVVGLMMSRVFGVKNADALRKAVQMGNAMQLTNILRDVGEDWERGRIYLPLEDLARFGYTEADLAAGVLNDNFRQLMAFEVARARTLYREGAAGLCCLANDGSRLTASAMAVIYGGILDAIERANYDVFSVRAHLTTGQKLRRLAGAWRLSRRGTAEVLPAVFGGK